MQSQQSLIERMAHASLVLQILVAIILGSLLAAFAPEAAQAFGLLGSLFVSALKAIAPILVFFLVMAALAKKPQSSNKNMQMIIVLYLLGTFSAALVAVALSFLFPVSLALQVETVTANPPQGIVEVLHGLVFKVVDNPINALSTGNFIGILTWAVGLGLVLRHASTPTRAVLHDLAGGVTSLVKFIIRLAPIGIFGLVANTIAQTGFSALLGYSHLLVILLSAMLIVALIVNPLITFMLTRENPYPLVLKCLRESGITAFFTRSSAANIPVNLELCRRLKLDPELYSVSIPLGATINMAGAAITITVLSLAAVHSLGMVVDFQTALLLCLLASISACGASGVAGGSLLLIPLAMSLFGIDNEIAMNVVAIGFIIGVIQDSAETALNSSTDVVFTSAVSRYQHNKASDDVSEGACSNA